MHHVLSFSDHFCHLYTCAPLSACFFTVSHSTLFLFLCFCSSLVILVLLVTDKYSFRFFVASSRMRQIKVDELDPSNFHFIDFYQYSRYRYFDKIYTIIIIFIILYSRHEHSPKRFPESLQKPSDCQRLDDLQFNYPSSLLSIHIYKFIPSRQTDIPNRYTTPCCSLFLPNRLILRILPLLVPSSQERWSSTSPPSSNFSLSPRGMNDKTQRLEALTWP